MNCRTTDELIRGERLGGLSPAEQRDLDAHLGSCARCRALVRPDLYAEPLQPPQDLLASILEETSGPACGRVEEFLSARFDGELDELDDGLVNVHAADCVACDALATAFSRLAEDLPAMRELQPDAAFANQVLALTSRSMSPRRPRSSERVRQLWNRLVQRPRFAWEAAYVGAMLFWLVMGAPLGVLPDSSANVRAYLPDLSDTRSAIQAMRDPVSDLGRRTMSTTRDGLASKTDALRRGLQKRGEELRVTLGSIDIEKGGKTVKAITEDAREAVSRFIQEQTSDDDNPQE